jgi:hypothetical protein
MLGMPACLLCAPAFENTPMAMLSHPMLDLVLNAYLPAGLVSSLLGGSCHLQGTS